jgi:hypothetical protein
MFVLLVSYQGREVYRKLFHRWQDADSWFGWRVKAMREGKARAPGDTVTLCNIQGEVFKTAGDGENVRTHS